jgi:acyl-CoA dehydrogenase
LADPAFRLMAEFFRAKGPAALKQEDQREEWYRDWIDFQAGHGLYASLLSPRQYSTRGHHLDLCRLTRFLEAFAYFAPAHAYSLHVSFLGLFPIWQSANEALKREAAARLEAGGLFAFAVSERDHGSDLLATEFALQTGESGGFHARGSKYYIGNANAAGLVTVLAKKAGPAGAPARRAPFVFFVLRPDEAPFESVRKIRTLGIRTAFVGEFRVADQSVPPGDVIAEGRVAWEAAFGAVDFGKFFLGFGAIGICEHAFAEAIDHMRRRVLYGKPVTDLPHIRAAVAGAFARLTAMKLYAYRALDYLYAAGPHDRRYLLFSAVQKARVSTEGVRVMSLLSECIGAKGFEADTYFETALREVPMIPGLEGSTHINFRLTAQFIDSYFADPTDGPPRPAAPPSVSSGPADPGENPYWLGPHDRHTRTVRFAPFRSAYRPHRAVPNARTFVRQVEAFRRLFIDVGLGVPDLVGDVALSIAAGRCFSAVAYGQLVAEGCAAAGASLSLVSAVFQGLIDDLTADALRLSALFPPGGPQRVLLKRVVRVPRTAAVDVESVFGSLGARFPT